METVYIISSLIRMLIMQKVSEHLVVMVLYCTGFQEFSELKQNNPLQNYKLHFS